MEGWLLPFLLPACKSHTQSACWNNTEYGKAKCTLWKDHLATLSYFSSPLLHLACTVQGNKRTHSSVANIYKFSRQSCTSHDTIMKGKSFKKWEQVVHGADFSTSSSRIFVEEENLLKFRHEGAERTLVKYRAGDKVNDLKRNDRTEECLIWYLMCCCRIM